MMVNKIDRPNTTPTVRAICKLAVYFSVFRPFSRFSLVYEGRWRYCIIRRKLEPLNCAMADLKRSKLCVICAVIFSLVWHLCYLPRVSVFFSFYCKICFLVSKYLLLRTKIWPRLLWTCCYLHSKLWRRARLLLELFASIVERFLSRVSYLPSDPTFFYWHVVALLRESYTFVQRNSHVFLALTDRAYVWSSMCRFLSPFDSSSTTTGVPSSRLEKAKN